MAKYPKCDSRGKKRFEDCVKKNKGRKGINPYAVCTVYNKCSPFRKR